ncbi:MAG: hypothetical protein ACKPKO_63075 [Candidatus Fonsibacter sp.]
MQGTITSSGDLMAPSIYNKNYVDNLPLLKHPTSTKQAPNNHNINKLGINKSNHNNLGTTGGLY